MADDKKKEKPKEKPAGWSFDLVEGALLLLFLLGFVATLIPALIGFVTSGEISFFGLKLSSIFDFFKAHVQFFKTLGFVAAGGSALGTFIFTKKADLILREEMAKLYPDNMTMSSGDATPEKDPMREKWEKIVRLSESDNSSDWRLSIIEADIILDNLLEKLQLPGDTMGEKLRAVEKSDFLTIESAWEAHKARNMIAHDGSDFLINQREIRHIISLYEAVFREFRLI